MHDDQHGTAIICAAGLVNALRIIGQDAGGYPHGGQRRGRGGIALLSLLKSMGMPHENCSHV